MNDIFYQPEPQEDFGDNSSGSVNFLNKNPKMDKVGKFEGLYDEDLGQLINLSKMHDLQAIKNKSSESFPKIEQDNEISSPDME